ncbi:MAG: SDR family oxidoreductase [Xanthomonadaceae bacterium]|nr:SDR family oxidoreductase [Xanthomonadaceae bacterium]
MSKHPSRHLLVAGCGDLGQRLAARLDDWSTHGLRRNPQGLPSSIQPVQADLGDRDSLRAVRRDWDAVVYTATPGERTAEAYRSIYVDGLCALLERVETRRLVLVSSTAVYGQKDGQWVDESSPTHPEAFNGRILLEAEQLARQAGACVLRFSGIYGPGRDYLIRKVRAGNVVCQRSPPVWTNRIHADDCAAALAHVLAMENPDPVYIASDAQPAPRREVLDWLATRLSAAPPHEPAQSARGQGKRVSAARLFSTGFTLQYPDYRAGYEAMLK